MVNTTEGAMASGSCSIVAAIAGICTATDTAFASYNGTEIRKLFESYWFKDDCRISSFRGWDNNYTRTMSEYFRIANVPQHEFKNKVHVEDGSFRISMKVVTSALWIAISIITFLCIIIIEFDHVILTDSVIDATSLLTLCFAVNSVLVATVSSTYNCHWSLYNLLRGQLVVSSWDMLPKRFKTDDNIKSICWEAVSKQEIAAQFRRSIAFYMPGEHGDRLDFVKQLKNIGK